jgi:hypothetical protein
MSPPGIEPGASVGGEHSRKGPFEQLVDSYSDHPHMRPRPAENVRDKRNILLFLIAGCFL